MFSSVTSKAFTSWKFEHYYSSRIRDRIQSKKGFSMTIRDGQRNPPAGKGGLPAPPHMNGKNRGADVGQNKGYTFEQNNMATLNNGYESFSDVGEIRVWFASKILTPCRMH